MWPTAKEHLIHRRQFWIVQECSTMPSSTPVSSSQGGHSCLWMARKWGESRALRSAKRRRREAFCLFHCTDDWSVLGCSAHESVSEAKARAERVYKGVSTRWLDANVSREAAEAYLNDLFENERCSMCGKRADEVDSLVQSGSAWICNLCAG